jgi:hypothetical protein
LQKERNEIMSDDLYTGSEAINWDEVSEDAPKPLENGFYFVTFAETKFQLTGKDKKPSSNSQLTVTKAWGGADDSLNRKVYDSLIFTKATAFRVLNVARVLGIPKPTEFTRETIEEFMAAMQASNGAWVRLKQETYKDKTNSRVERFYTEEQVRELVEGDSTSAKKGDDAPAATGTRGSRRPRS